MRRHPLSSGRFAGGTQSERELETDGRMPRAVVAVLQRGV